MPSPDLITELEKKLEYSFKNKEYLRDALTHSSTGEQHNYERLEFLGDRVLGLVVAGILYLKFPGEKEGDLAKRLASLVQGSWLAKIAHDIDLGRYMDFSDAERSAGGNDNDNILADGMESLLGAIYLDSDLATCESLITRLWGDAFETMKRPPLHPKTRLQEWAQAQALPLPCYEITGQSGPDHAPIFDIKLTISGHGEIIAQGRSRQIAEKEAASQYIKMLRKKNVEI